MYDNYPHGLSRWLDAQGIKYELNANLSKKTWIRNGGIAGFYIIPEDIHQLEGLLSKLSELKSRYIVVGHTSNMFFPNSYNPDVIITTRKVKNFSIKDDMVICECGAPLMKVARECIRRGISGYEGLVGIPGTVGAAVCNNSGAYGCEMSKLVKRVEVIMEDGEKKWLTNDELEFSYRNSTIKSGRIRCCILRVELSAHQKESPEVLQARADEYTATRKRYYEDYNQNLGTVFYNLDLYSGRLLLRISLKIHKYLTYPLPLSIQNKTRKFLILAYFNKLRLYPYISEKRMNCFIWNKEAGYHDEVFYEYIEFIKSKSKKEPTLEIQIVDGKME